MGVNDGNDNGMYVWRDPRRHGYPISSPDVPQMISFAKGKQIKRILYDSWGNGILPGTSGWEQGSGRQDDAFLDSLIAEAHAEGILVEALYTDNLRFSEVSRYNKDRQNKFDGIRMNYEGPWNHGASAHSTEVFYEPVSYDDIDYFMASKRKTGSAQVATIPRWLKNVAKWWSQGKTADSEFVNAIQHLIREGIIHVKPEPSSGTGASVIPGWIKNNAGWWADGQIDDSTFLDGIQFLVQKSIIRIPPSTPESTIPLYASISWHWGRADVPNPDSPIEYGKKSKMAYQHILDIVDGVDIQTAWGGANAVDAILFRVLPIVQYARSIDKPAWITIETSDQAPANQTFAEEGINEIESTAKVLLSALKSQGSSPAGMIYHFYKNTYG